MAEQLSWQEHTVHTRGVGGSNPFPATFDNGSLMLCKGFGGRENQRGAVALAFVDVDGPFSLFEADFPLGTQLPGGWGRQMVESESKDK